KAFAILTVFFALGGAVAAAAGVPVGSAVPTVLAIGFAAAIGAGARESRRRAALPRTDPTATMRIAPGHLVVEEGEARWRVPRARLSAAWIVPDVRGAARVIFAGKRGRTLEAWLPSIGEARALLAELRLGPLERPVTFAFFFGLRV